MEDAAARGSKFRKEKPEPLTSEEAYALLGYITRLESDVNYYRSRISSIPTEETHKRGKFEKKDLEHAFTKLVGLAGTHQSSNETS